MAIGEAELALRAWSALMRPTSRAEMRPTSEASSSISEASSSISEASSSDGDAELAAALSRSATNLAESSVSAMLRCGWVLWSAMRERGALEATHLAIRTCALLGARCEQPVWLRSYFLQRLGLTRRSLAAMHASTPAANLDEPDQLEPRRLVSFDLADDLASNLAANLAAKLELGPAAEPAPTQGPAANAAAEEEELPSRMHRPAESSRRSSASSRLISASISSIEIEAAAHDGARDGAFEARARLRSTASRLAHDGHLIGAAQAHIALATHAHYVDADTAEAVPSIPTRTPSPPSVPSAHWIVALPHSHAGPRPHSDRCAASTTPYSYAFDTHARGLT